MTKRQLRLAAACGLVWGVLGITGSCQARGEELQSVEVVPVHGTFFSLQNALTNGPAPPWPFHPYPWLELYEGTQPGIYYFDDRGFAEQDLKDLAFARALDSTLAGEDPPWPGGEFGGEDPGVECGPPVYTLGGLALLPPVVSQGEAVLNVTNADLSAIYDWYATTNLSPYVEGLNLTNWVWLGRGVPGQTSFSTPALSDWQNWFRLGTSVDSDGDGLTDAYENLVSHTPVNIFTSLASDGLGTPDAWYLQQGLNPRTSGIAGLDGDEDGLSNRQEYLNGSSPRVKPVFDVWVSQPGRFGLP